jgi:hypothetical protein
VTPVAKAANIVYFDDLASSHLLGAAISFSPVWGFSHRSFMAGVALGQPAPKGDGVFFLMYPHIIPPTRNQAK